MWLDFDKFFMVVEEMVKFCLRLVFYLKCLMKVLFMCLVLFGFKFMVLGWKCMISMFGCKVNCFMFLGSDLVELLVLIICLDVFFLVRLIL